MPWSVTEVAHDVMYIIRRTLIHDDLDTAEDEDIVLAYHDYIDDELLARISYQDEQAVYDNIAARSEMIDVPDEEFDRVQERTLNYLEYHLNYREDSEPAHQTAPAA